MLPSYWAKMLLFPVSIETFSDTVLEAMLKLIVENDIDSQEITTIYIIDTPYIAAEILVFWTAQMNRWKNHKTLT